MLKVFKIPRQFKKSSEVFEFFKNKKAEDGVIAHKGGHAVVRGGMVKKIYVGPSSLNDAKRDK